MKKFLTIFITPIAMLFLTIVKLPSVEPYLYEKKNLSSETVNQTHLSGSELEAISQGKIAKGIDFFGLSVSYVLMIQVFLVVATILTYYVTMYSPYNRYEKLAKKRWFIIDNAAQRLATKYQEHVINFNIMVPKRKFFYFIEPSKNNTGKSKFTITGTVFETVWSYGEGPNRKLKITTNQGTAGEVFKEGRRIISIDFTVNHGQHINFTDKQKELCKDLKMLATSPIILRKEDVDRQKVKVIGVFNIEGTSEGAESIITNTQTNANFFKDLYSMSELCATLLE